MDYCIGIMGTPSNSEIAWSNKKIEELKHYGFNMMQLNIAWGSRPNDEPLNLQDVLILDEQTLEEKKSAEKRREKIRERIQICKQHNMRTLFHFGAPYNGIEPYQGMDPKVCFNSKKSVKYYCDLLEELQRQIPGIDDLLIYTYDQDAWLCSEFSYCENCRGIPLHKRLPFFLSSLCTKWSEINKEGRIWWECWELSAGQTLKMIECLPQKAFGMMVHSNIGEVQKTRAVDMWFRNVCMLANKRNIPVVAELFLGESCEETEPLKRIPCPSHTYTQIKAVLNQDGVLGIKEYYGLLPGTNDPCLQMVGQVVNYPERSLDECLNKIAEQYKENKKEIVQFWKWIAEAYMLYPWDVSWFARECGRSTVDHGWNAAFLRGQQCSTPSWESTRHSVFMKTDDEQPHPWMLEDVGLRFDMSFEYMNKAYEIGKTIRNNLSEDQQSQMEESLQSIQEFGRICKSYSLHIRETNLAMLLRQEKGMDTVVARRLHQEMIEVLQMDVKNQGGKGRVVNIMESYRNDPKEWLALYLLPINEDIKEKGHFALTTR